jgi:hypothetical protein
MDHRAWPIGGRLTRKQDGVLISQRVVNDTAQTLTEIVARFPGP